MRAGLGVYPLTLLGGWISTQYVHAHVFSLLVPGFVGLACAAAAEALAGSIALAAPIAGLGALLAVGLGDRLVVGGVDPVHPLGQAGPPYLAGLVGVALWPLLSGWRHPSGTS